MKTLMAVLMTAASLAHAGANFKTATAPEGRVAPTGVAGVTSVSRVDVRLGGTVSMGQTTTPTAVRTFTAPVAIQAPVALNAPVQISAALTAAPLTGIAKAASATVPDGEGQGASGDKAAPVLKGEDANADPAAMSADAGAIFDNAAKLKALEDLHIPGHGQANQRMADLIETLARDTHPQAAAGLVKAMNRDAAVDPAWHPDRKVVTGAILDLMREHERLNDPESAAFVARLNALVKQSRDSQAIKTAERIANGDSRRMMTLMWAVAIAILIWAIGSAHASAATATAAAAGASMLPVALIAAALIAGGWATRNMVKRVQIAQERRALAKTEYPHKVDLALGSGDRILALEAVQRRQDAPFFTRAVMGIAADETTPYAERNAAIQTLRVIDPRGSASALLEVAKTTKSPGVRHAAIGAVLAADDGASRAELQEIVRAELAAAVATNDWSKAVMTAPVADRMYNSKETGEAAEQLLRAASPVVGGKSVIAKAISTMRFRRSLPDMSGAAFAVMAAIDIELGLLAIAAALLIGTIAGLAWLLIPHDPAAKYFTTGSTGEGIDGLVEAYEKLQRKTAKAAAGGGSWFGR